MFRYIIELCHLRLLQARGRLCIFLLLNSRVAVTDIVVPKGCSITRKCHEKLWGVGDGGLTVLGVERIAVNRRDCLAPIMLEHQPKHILFERAKAYLSVRTTFVNRYRTARHDIETHVVEPGPLLRGHLVDTVMCNRVLHCCDPKVRPWMQVFGFRLIHTSWS